MKPELGEQYTGTADVGPRLAFIQPEIYVFDSNDPIEKEAARILYDSGPMPIRLARSVAEQHLAGRIGGGPQCPGCGKRELYRLPNDHRFQCRHCLAGSTLHVMVNGIEMRAIPVEGQPVAVPEEDHPKGGSK